MKKREERNSDVMTQVCRSVINVSTVFLSRTSRKLLRIKVTPDLHLTYNKKWGKPGVGIEKEKYSLYINFIDKTCKIYLFIFV